MKKFIGRTIAAVLFTCLVVCGCGDLQIRDLDSEVTSSQSETEDNIADFMDEIINNTSDTSKTDDADTEEAADSTEAVSDVEETLPAFEEASESDLDDTYETEAVSEAMPYDAYHSQYYDLLINFMSGNEYIAESKCFATTMGDLYYNQNYQGAFSLFDIDDDGADELFLCAHELSGDGKMDYVNVYRGNADGTAKFWFSMIGFTEGGKILRYGSDSSIDCDYSVGKLVNGEYVEEIWFSISEDESESQKKVGEGQIEEISASEYYELLYKYSGDCDYLTGINLTRDNVEKVFGKTSDLTEVVVATTDGGVNVRMHPDANSEKIMSMVPDGVHMFVIEFANSSSGKQWGKISAGGRYGWIAMSQVRIVE